jgi:hypothetical protein
MNSLTATARGLDQPLYNAVGEVADVAWRTLEIKLNPSKEGSARTSITYTEARSCNLVAVKKAMSISYSKCVSVALGTQHAMRISRIMLSSVAGPALRCLSILSHNKIFEKKLLNIKFVFLQLGPCIFKV